MSNNDNTRLMHRKTVGPLTHLLSNLSGDEGKIWLHEFKKFLRKEEVWLEFAAQGTSFIPSLSVPTVELFNESKTGRDKQCHSDEFKELLVSVGSVIKTSDLKIQKHVLQERAYEFDFIELLGGKHRIIHRNKESALVTLSRTMIDYYRDNSFNVAFYLNSKSKICRVNCDWLSASKTWRLHSHEIHGSPWDVGTRIFYPEN